MEQKTLTVTKGVDVLVTPSEKHEFLMDTKEVANGYGVAVTTLRSCKHLNKGEFIEGKHFIYGVWKTNAGCKSVSYEDPPINKIFWTKAGIVRLGFFIKSGRAKLFRDWVEQLVLLTLQAPPPIADLAALPKRKHNRLTAERMLDIMTDVCMIEDTELRLRIASKLTQQ